MAKKKTISKAKIEAKKRRRIAKKLRTKQLKQNFSEIEKKLKRYEELEAKKNSETFNIKKILEMEKKFDEMKNKIIKLEKALKEKDKEKAIKTGLKKIKTIKSNFDKRAEINKEKIKKSTEEKKNIEKKQETIKESIKKSKKNLRDISVKDEKRSLNQLKLTIYKDLEEKFDENLKEAKKQFSAENEIIKRSFKFKDSLESHLRKIDEMNLTKESIKTYDRKQLYSALKFFDFIDNLKFPDTSLNMLRERLAILWSFHLEKLVRNRDKISDTEVFSDIDSDRKFINKLNIVKPDRLKYNKVKKFKKIDDEITYLTSGTEYIIEANVQHNLFLELPHLDVIKFLNGERDLVFEEKQGYENLQYARELEKTKLKSIESFKLKIKRLTKNISKYEKARSRWSDKKLTIEEIRTRSRKFMKNRKTHISGQYLRLRNVIEDFPEINEDYGYYIIKIQSEKIISEEERKQGIVEFKRIKKNKNELMDFFKGKNFKNVRYVNEVSNIASDTEIIKTLSYSTSFTIVYQYSIHSRREGSFFRYFHKTDLNLEKYGIFKYPENKDDENEVTKKLLNEVKKNCLEHALIRSEKITKGQIDHLSDILIGLEIPRNKLRKICDEIGVGIKLKSSFIDGKNIARNVKLIEPDGEDEFEIVDILLMTDHQNRGHYMLNEKVKATYYSVKNYEKVKHMKNHFNIVGKSKIQFLRKKKPEIKLSELIRLMYQENLLIEIPSDIIQKCQYHSKKDLIEDLYYHYNCVLPTRIHEIQQNSQYIMFYDTEAIVKTKSSIHVPFCICCRYGDFYNLNKRESRSFYGLDCVSQFFDFITETFKDQSLTLISHNMRYDCQFLIRYDNFKIKSNILKSGNRIKLINAYLFNKDWLDGDFEKLKKRIPKVKLRLIDSYSFIERKLSDFDKMFKIEGIKKEVYPYTYLTEFMVSNNDWANVNNALDHIELNSFDVSENYFPDKKTRIKMLEERKNQFIKNIKELNLMNDKGEFNIKKYTIFYCNQDCMILDKGFSTFRKWLADLSEQMIKMFGDEEYHGDYLDIANMISIVQYSHTLGKYCNVFKDIYSLRGKVRDFIGKTVFGGRVMVRDNKKYIVNKILDDFDAVNLYGTAMTEMGNCFEDYLTNKIDDSKKIIDCLDNKCNHQKGLLIGKPKVIDKKFLNKEYYEVPEEIKKWDGLFAEIKILEVNKKRHFPFIIKRIKDQNEYKNSVDDKNENEELALEYTNEPITMFLNKQHLKILIKWHKIKFKIIRGYYFDNGRNGLLFKKFITFLFNERLAKKNEKNPIEVVYKLIINSFYGRLNMRPIEKNMRILTKCCLDFNRNLVVGFIKFGKDRYLTELKKSINSYSNYCHIGSEVLSFSKIIMSRVMYLAEDNDIDIWYTDTDSMLINSEKIDTLASEYFKTYDLKLIGKNLGQFHVDFKAPFGKLNKSRPVSARTALLAKKTYMGELIPENEIKKYKNNDQTAIKPFYHTKAKGICSVLIHMKAEEMKCSPFELYVKLYNNELIDFDISKIKKFKFEKDFTTTNRSSFYRYLYFPDKEIQKEEQKRIINAAKKKRNK